MRGSRASRILVPALAVVGLVCGAIPLSAGIFKRTDSPRETIELWKIHEAKGGIYYGRVLEKQILDVNLPDSGDVQVTRLKIAVSESVSRLASQKEIVALYRGGDTYRTSAQPSDEETAVGVDAIFLVTENPYADLFPQTFWIAGLNSVFRVQKSSTNRLVAIGKGSGMAVAENTDLDEFVRLHREQLARMLPR
jgi:hypothetical protein